jgi:enoyl-[acyl-carrier-protein] reductase (NADH)
MRRASTARETGLMAVYLASPASDFMTGQIVQVDGGQVLA